jgi:hypothetical protein
MIYHIKNYIGELVKQVDKIVEKEMEYHKVLRQKHGARNNRNRNFKCKTVILFFNCEDSIRQILIINKKKSSRSTN